ncbi:DUF572-domain-containing protein [Aureobasidium subglaciale]|uniref:Splicing factor YJU2 n=1 Tax=Aureobasidium subglaciale (strain EXF-2481) TaxID=1043005 RepID=A0A074YW03_AURSE|nr:uncharacterized protein AUEXF2481DRAFT_24671 [Aureobasidium subglaciale EXF-2481]KAI5212131.1 DUF572-domain-containing protein [Aureobasidium subglaciale]KAI5231296.1 DUF572-domain-containing protein [Aureobasidium subglaciale]KAI5234078.1 DUF572-domain-containing protein [Aureobasidium subglaciale]KAI5257194.1 DUF572-domain-containing protein [Aureobasidium subglaciale]KAI5267624.1 DUF572-domain-containing protein [Aureobasidium subglaciale]
MSERKVLTKYFPPDFDPSKMVRTRKTNTGPQLQTVRLMAPYSMKCTACGEFIYKGRKFNARKETTDEKYYAITIYRFYIKCTRCSQEITFKTDPKNMDYEAEKGAKRNFEPWREAKLAEETEEERLDRLEREEAERDAMKELETKTLDAKTEMQIADALDEIRTRNARNERTAKDGAEVTVVDKVDDERERQEAEDAEAARQAFLAGTGEKVRRLVEDPEEEGSGIASGPATTTTTSTSVSMGPPPVPTFARKLKKKTDFSAKLGIKKKSLV